MSNGELAKPDSKALTVQAFLNGDKVKKYLEDVLRERAPQFITSLVSMSNLTPGLAQCEPRSLMMCGLKAASLNLPLDNNLGFAYAIPYKGKDSGKVEAQFQIGYKGYIQLALRTNQYRALNVLDVREGEVKSWNPFTEDVEFSFIEDEAMREKAPVVGFMAMFELQNGFSKTIYRRKEALLSHGKRFSKSFKAGPWQTDTDAMCMKTLLKGMLSKWGPLTSEIIEASKYDQSVIRQKENGEDYPDFIDVQMETPKELSYDLTEEEMEDFTTIFDILGTPEAERAMKLGACRGDKEKLSALRKDLIQKVDEKASKK